MICPLNIFQTTNLQVYCPLCFCLSLPYFSFSYTQQTCQSVRRACWSSATCFRVWRSCTGPILLRLSRHCRSVRYPWFISLDMQSRVAHYNCDLILGLRNWTSKLSSSNQTYWMTKNLRLLSCFVFYRVSPPIVFLRCHVIAAKYRIHLDLTANNKKNTSLSSNINIFSFGSRGIYIWQPQEGKETTEEMVH